MRRHIAAVLGAGICWGTMGFFTRNLAQMGIGSDGAIIIRCAVAVICFALVMLLKDPSSFKVKPKDFWCFLGSGLLSFLFFTFCYFTAISMMSLSAAAILLYIAPIVVTLLSALLFKEKLTPVKIIAVITAFAGCCLVSGLMGGISITGKGLLFGIGSGVGYALYTIFSRFALQRGYTSNTINFYSCLLAGIGAVIIWHPHDLLANVFASSGSVAFCIIAGVVTCFVPYLLYTDSLTGLENGKASVLASIEPVVASIVGVLLFGETLGAANIAGVILVLAAVVLLNVKTNRSEEGSAR